MRKRKTTYVWSFVDIVFNSLFLFIVLFALTVTKLKKENETTKKLALETDGLYAIVASWPAEHDDDVDLYVRDPSGKTVFYGQTAVELMHLEYDDRGALGDRAMTSTGETKVDLNQERVVVRAAMAGEYVVNVRMYQKSHPSPTTVKVSLYRLRGDDTVILTKERTLAATQDEATAFRFTLSPDGEMTGSNELPTGLHGSTGDGAQGGMSFPGGSFP